MLGFARGLKSIRSALLNLVELGTGTRQIGPISGYISNHQLHTSHFQLKMPITTLISNKANVTLIHPMSYKPRFFIDEILQCLVDKYQITYQNIWGGGVVRPHLVELDRCEILEPLKWSPDLNHFLHKKRFLVIAVAWKRNSKITKLTKIFREKGQLDS